ncbi:MAG TPA: hypothetical protein VEK56_03945 [Vicinamibacterales bacterium]|nr:hypothetical protein [Vicinamibacterales bacterium]
MSDSLRFTPNRRVTIDVSDEIVPAMPASTVIKARERTFEDASFAVSNERPGARTPARPTL